MLDLTKETVKILQSFKNLKNFDVFVNIVFVNIIFLESENIISDIYFVQICYMSRLILLVKLFFLPKYLSKETLSLSISFLRILLSKVRKSKKKFIQILLVIGVESRNMRKK